MDTKRIRRIKLRATSYELRAMSRLCLLLIAYCLLPAAASAQRVALLQLERYLGKPLGPERKNYVGLTDSAGDQHYRKLDSIIVRIADSLIDAIPPYVDIDTDEQTFDTCVIVNDTLILSIIRDNQPAYRLDLKKYVEPDKDWYEVGTFRPPDTIGDYIWKYGRVTIGENASYDQDLAVPMSDIRVHDIIIGYSADGESSNLRIGAFNLVSNTTGMYNTAIGMGAMNSTTTGSSNFALGFHSLYYNTSGMNLTAIGANALYSNIDGIYNTAIGNSSQYSNVDGTNNVGIGYFALHDNVVGSFNTAIGDYTLSQSIGSNNVAIGYESNRQGGSDNTAIGTHAGHYNTGSRNIFIGFEAGEMSDSNDKLYIDNSNAASPLIYGDFAGDTVRVNGSLQVTNRTGIPQKVAGWRDADNKITNVGLGTGLSIDTLGVLNATRDSQYVDSFAIISNILGVSLVRDGRAKSTVDLTPYLDNTDAQYLDSAFILNDTLYLSISGDGQPAKKIDLKHYIDTAFADTDRQKVDTFYFHMDTLYISLERDNEPLHAVYLGDLITLADQDRQRFDRNEIVNDTIWQSIQRDSVADVALNLKPYLDNTDNQYTDTFAIVGNILRKSETGDNRPFFWVDLSPYLDNTDNQYPDTFGLVGYQFRFSLTGDNRPYYTADFSSLSDPPQNYNHAGTTSYTNTLSITGSTFTLNAGTSIGIAHNGTGGVTISNTGMTNWLLNGADDAYGSTTILNGNTVNIQGSGGITAKLAANGSSTLLIDGSTIVDNYVDDVYFNTATSILTIGRNIMGDLTDTVMDNDWYGVGTLLPPAAITTSMFHTGKTGIGMNPVWLLDVSEDARINGHQIGVGNYASGGDNSNIRFGKNALGSNVSGVLNLAIATNALAANTTGYDNLAIGYDAMKYNTTGHLNTAIGENAMKNSSSAYDNTAVGIDALNLITIGQYNTAIGHATLSANSSSSENTAVGDYAMEFDPAPNKNVALGRFSAVATTNNTGNTLLGYYTMGGSSSSGSSYNTAVGFEAYKGSGSGVGSYNIAMGYRAMGVVSATLSSNIFIGNQAGYGISGNRNIGVGDSTQNNTIGDNNATIGNGITVGSNSNNTVLGRGTLTTSGNAVLTNGLGTVALWMLSSGNVGIGGEVNPTQKLHVTGNARISGSIYDSNNDPGTSGQILSSTVTGTDWVSVGAGTVTSVAATAPPSGFTIAGSPITGSGTFTFALNNDLLGVENLATNGIVARTASNTWTTRIITAGTGISIVDGDGILGNPTITASEVDGSVTNEGSLSVLAGISTTSLIHSNTSGSTDVTLTAGTNMTISEVGNVITLASSFTEVDGSITNEGSLTVGVGASNTSIINSNTSGSTPVTLTAGTNMTISESGNVITLASTEVDGSVTNEIQSWNSSGTTSYTGSLSLGGGGFTLQSSGIVGISNSVGIVTISATEVDGSITNEGSLSVGAGAANESQIKSNTSGSAIITLLAGTGISLAEFGNTIEITNTATGTVTSVAAVAPAAGLTITGSPVTTSGTFTFALANDLAALEGLTTAGMAARNNVGSWFTRSISPGVGISVSNGDGVAGDPTISATDATITNEGSLTVGAGASNTSIINSNTSGSTGVTITAGTGMTISEVGNVITLNSTATGTVTSVAATAPGSGLTISGSPITGSGTFGFALANDLAAVEGLATTGIAVRTANDSWATRSIAAGSGISVTFADGVSGNPTITATDQSISNEGQLTGTYVTGSSYNLTSNSSGSSTIGFLLNTTGNNTALKFNNVSNQYNLYLREDVIYYTAGLVNSGTTRLSSVPTYADEAAATGGGLSTGTVYKTATGEVRIKL